MRLRATGETNRYKKTVEEYRRPAGSRRARPAPAWRDIARVKKVTDYETRNALRATNRRHFHICLSGTDITKVGKEVDRTLVELQATQLPAGLETHKVFFQPERVNDALDTFLINLLESVVIVVVLLMFTMGFPTAEPSSAAALDNGAGSLLVLDIFQRHVAMGIIGQRSLVKAMACCWWTMPLSSTAWWTCTVPAARESTAIGCQDRHACSVPR